MFNVVWILLIFIPNAITINYKDEFGTQCADFEPTISDQNVDNFLTVEAFEYTLNLYLNPQEFIKEGNYGSYVIYSEYAGSLECPDVKIVINRTILISNYFRNDIEMKNLLPSSCYNIFICTVDGYNEDLSSILINIVSKVQTTYCTKQSTKLISTTTSEYPKIEHYLEEDNNELVLSAITNCNVINKFKNLVINIFCISTSCSTCSLEKDLFAKSWNIEPYREFRKLLQPHCKYTIEIFVKDSMNYKDPKQIIYNVTTESFESKQPDVSKLQVISKNDSSVSLRWRPPYSPYGKLETYLILYGYDIDDSTLKYDLIDPSPCKLWPSFHCVTIFTSQSKKINIQSKIEYNYIFWLVGYMSLSSENNLIYPTLSASIDIKFDEIASEPPYDVEIQWKNDEDIMRIDWKHPNNTNGLLSHFSINVLIHKTANSIFHIYYVINSENDYKFLYHLEINPKMERCTQYALVLSSHNKNGLSSKSDNIISFYSPPPSLNSFLNNIRIRTGSTSISIQFSTTNKICSLVETQIIIFCVAADFLKYNQTVLDKINQKLNATNAVENCLVVYAMTVKEAVELTIGNSMSSFSNYLNLELFHPKKLTSETGYTIKAILIYEYKDSFKPKYKSEIFTVETLSLTSELTQLTTFNELYWLLLLLLIIPIGIIIFRKKFSIVTKNTENQNHPTETQTLQTLQQSTVELKYENCPGRESHLYETIDESSHFYEKPREVSKNTYLELLQCKK